MPCDNSLKFKGIDHYGDPTLMEELEGNLKQWFDWAFLSIGAWQEIDGTPSGTTGSHETLNSLQDNNYTDNTIYRSLRKDWIHETGVDYNSPTQVVGSVEELNGDMKVMMGANETSYYSVGDKINLSTPSLTGEFNVTSIVNSTTIIIDSTDSVTENGGEIYGIYNPSVPKVYVDGVVVSSSVYSIDYPNGKVIFNSAQNSSAVVKASYAFRNVQSYVSNSVPWSYEVQNSSFDVGNTSWIESAVSGEFGSDPGERVQLPAVIIESVAKRTATGFQLGSAAMRINQDVLITVVSENKYERNIITDILAQQKHKSIVLYDSDVVNKHGAFPLTYEGDIAAAGMSYAEIVADNKFFWANAYITETSVSEVHTNSPDLHMSKVRLTLEVIK